MILGIDPGLTGAFVLTNGRQIQVWPMPILVNGKDKAIDFHGVREILKLAQTGLKDFHIYLERAIPMAMGSKHAFNYGRGFAAIEIAILLSGLPVTYIEPSKWAKVMHEGVSGDLKAKAKSMIAATRLFPILVRRLPQTRKGLPHDGFIDALLIAGYGLRQRAVQTHVPDDFY